MKQQNIIYRQEILFGKILKYYLVFDRVTN